jgi:hypothetical protein
VATSVAVSTEALTSSNSVVASAETLSVMAASD